MKRVAFQRPFFSNRPVHRIEQTTFDRLVALLEANSRRASAGDSSSTAAR